MAGGSTARRVDRGGERIQAPRVDRTRLIFSAAALACAAGVAAYPAASASRLSWLEPTLAALALGLLAAGLLLRWAPLVVWSIAAIGAEYAVWLTLAGEDVNTRAPLVGGGLFLLAELAFDSIDSPAGRIEPDVLLRRLVALAALAVGAFAVGVVALGAAAAPVTGGVALTAIGTAAAVLALALIARLASRRGTSASDGRGRR
jgi:hypothetical protein